MAGNGLRRREAGVKGEVEPESYSLAGAGVRWIAGSGSVVVWDGNPASPGVMLGEG